MENMWYAKGKKHKWLLIVDIKNILWPEKLSLVIDY